ncbi:MAG: hypothetical protein F6K39_21995, partial [Okeania sp. SIO3B3]|nr:hypothetical protein [Okeania sp. SIO3B3]
ITIPGEGTFTTDDEGNFTFTPQEGFEGEASFILRPNYCLLPFSPPGRG